MAWHNDCGHQGRNDKCATGTLEEKTGMGFGDSLRAAEDREGPKDGKVLLQRHLWCTDDLQG